MAQIGTKTKLLDVAEKMFADKGIPATSLRKIIAEAGVNLAAIHYHFGSKEALVREVVLRRVKPVNEERLRRLDELEQSHRNNASDPEALIRAFIEPVIRIRFENPQRTLIILKLVHQIQADSAELKEIIFDLFADVANRFIAAFEKALPHLSRAELIWRFKFMLGVMHMIMAQPPIGKHGFDFENTEMDLDSVTRQVVPFLVAGFKAPATAITDGDKK